jgi:hypothetical protein
MPIPKEGATRIAGVATGPLAFFQTKPNQTKPNNTMSESETPQWAIVELMGHVRYGGLVSKDSQFGTAMLRVDVPQKDGSFVSQLVNPTSIYRLTLCSEEIGRVAAAQGDPTPMSVWELKHLLPAPDGTEAENLLPEEESDFPL